MALVDSICPGCGIQNWTHTGFCDACLTYGTPKDAHMDLRVRLAKNATIESRPPLPGRALSDDDINAIVAALLKALEK